MCALRLINHIHINLNINVDVLVELEPFQLNDHQWRHAADLDLCVKEANEVKEAKQVRWSVCEGGVRLYSVWNKT